MWDGETRLKNIGDRLQGGCQEKRVFCKLNVKLSCGNNVIKFVRIATTMIIDFAASYAFDTRGSCLLFYGGCLQINTLYMYCAFRIEPGPQPHVYVVPSVSAPALHSSVNEACRF